MRFRWTCYKDNLSNSFPKAFEGQYFGGFPNNFLSFLSLFSLTDDDFLDREDVFLYLEDVFLDLEDLLETFLYICISETKKLRTRVLRTPGRLK